MGTSRPIARRHPSDGGRVTAISGLPRLLGKGNMPGRLVIPNGFHGSITRTAGSVPHTDRPSHGDVDIECIEGESRKAGAPSEALGSTDRSRASGNNMNEASGDIC